MSLHMSHEDDLMSKEGIADGTSELRIDATFVAQVSRHRLFPLVPSATSGTRIAVFAVAIGWRHLIRRMNVRSVRMVGASMVTTGSVMDFVGPLASFCNEKNRAPRQK